MTTYYYYVKDDGIETGTASNNSGRFTSMKTGDWTTAMASTDDYYAEIGQAFTDINAGLNTDFHIVLVSDLHAETTASNPVWLTLTNGLAWIVSVDDLNCENYKKRTSGYHADLSGDIKFTDANQAQLTLFGIRYRVNDDSLYEGNGSEINMYEGLAACQGTNDTAFAFADQGISINCYDTEVENGGSGPRILSLGRGSFFRFKGGSWGNSGYITSNVDGRQGNVEFYDADLSDVDRVLNADTFTDTDGGKFLFKRSEFKQYPPFAAGSNYTTNTPALIMELIQCSDDTSIDGAEYHYNYVQGDSYCLEDTGIYRDASNPFPVSNQKISLRCVSGATRNYGNPFILQLPTFLLTLNSGPNETVRFFLASSDSGLTDEDIKIYAGYPDRTNTYNPNVAISAPIDPFSSGTTLTTNSEAWTGDTGETLYQVDVDLSTDPGEDCIPDLFLWMAKASTTVFLCPSPEAV